VSALVCRRVLTAILYLNDPEWDCAVDGGALRCYLDADMRDETGQSERRVHARSACAGQPTVHVPRA
jgi:hypothetical protein